MRYRSHSLHLFLAQKAGRGSSLLTVDGSEQESVLLVFVQCLPESDLVSSWAIKQILLQASVAPCSHPHCCMQRAVPEERQRQNRAFVLKTR